MGGEAIHHQCCKSLQDVLQNYPPCTSGCEGSATSTLWLKTPKTHCNVGARISRKPLEKHVTNLLSYSKCCCFTKFSTQAIPTQNLFLLS
ncbi:hypothetical protein CY35_12G083200 [Sphagnum magellanicum]|nr:hypothetical protein CY35_12G083200 [Sphagnum magellanicum]